MTRIVRDGGHRHRGGGTHTLSRLSFRASLGPETGTPEHFHLSPRVSSLLLTCLQPLLYTALFYLIAVQSDVHLIVCTRAMRDKKSAQKERFPADNSRG